MNPATTRQHLKASDFTPIFLEEFGWDHCQQSFTVTTGGRQFRLTALAEKCGLVAYACAPADGNGQIPDRALRLKTDREVTQSTYEHLLVFTDPKDCTKRVSAHSLARAPAYHHLPRQSVAQAHRSGTERAACRWPAAHAVSIPTGRKTYHRRPCGPPQHHRFGIGCRDPHLPCHPRRPARRQSWPNTLAAHRQMKNASRPPPNATLPCP